MNKISHILEMFTDGELFDFNLKYLLIAGLWPNDDWPRSKRILYRLYMYLMDCLTMSFIITSSIGSLRVKHNIPLLFSNMDKSMVVYNFVLKRIDFVRISIHLQSLVYDIRESGDIVEEKKKKLMAYHIIILTSMAAGLTGVYCLLAMLNNEMIVEAWLPFDPYKNFTNLLMSFQLLSTFFMPTLLRGFSMQGFMCSVVIYFCDQLVEIKDRIAALKYSKENEKFMRDEFKRIIVKHIRIIRYVNNFKGLCKVYFLIQNFFVTSELCLNAVMITLIGSEDKILFMSFLTYLAIALINSYIYCFLGNELIIHSTGIADAAYGCDWTSWPNDLKKNILLIMTVAQRPLTLSAGGMSVMCMQSYSQALYNAYSLFALLNDMID